MVWPSIAGKINYLAYLFHSITLPLFNCIAETKVCSRLLYLTILKFFFQGYVVCPSEKRFLLLFTFLKKNRKKKLMVFFSSCMSVKYHYELLNYIDLPVLAIHVSILSID